MCGDKYVAFNTMFENRIWQIVTVMCMAVIFIYTLQVAYINGKTKSQAETVIRNSSEVVKALDFFYADQGRFPSAHEFLEIPEKNVLTTYMHSFPPRSYDSGTCSQSYKYEYVSAKSYSFSFCISVDSGAYHKGWNKTIVTK